MKTLSEERYTNIAKHLNDNGFKSPSFYQHKLLGKNVGNKKTKMCRNHMWNERTVDRILANSAYCGTLICHKTETSKIKKTHREVDEEEQFHHENFFPPIIDLLDDIVASGTISKATIHLLVEKIIVHQVDEETIDVQFRMKGAFKNHIDLYDTLNGMASMNEETVGQTLIKVLDTVEQMTA